MKKACEKKMRYDFSHYLLVCKAYEMKTGHNNVQTIFSNSEEELFLDVRTVLIWFFELTLFLKNNHIISQWV